VIEVLAAESRGRTRLPWLDSRHTFSFGEYYDPARMGFGPLRVINEDVVRGGGGFGTHPHRDMEILTWVLEGALDHRDTLGTGSVLRAGELQRMTAGTGIQHSERNASATEPVHFLQIWILPDRRGLAPEYEQRSVGRDALAGRLVPVARKGGAEGALSIHQDVVLYASVLADGDRVEHEPSPGRQCWIQVARGSISIHDTVLREGDGAAIRDAGTLRIVGASPSSEFLLFDLPG
jgi:redox-sensitive bicupin YhaK (pirin superfamily)